MGAHTDHPDATTAFGFDRMVQAMNKGNVGIRTGSTGRPGGRMHLADSATKVTACGSTINSTHALIVPRHGMDGEAWATRMVTCQRCRKAVGIA